MERRKILRSKKFIIGFTVGVLLILSGVAWVERTQLVVAYSVHRLVRAQEGERQGWAERVAALDLLAMPKLIDCLRQADARVCANAEAGLFKMVQHWQAGDSRRAELAGCLAQRFAMLSEPGQQTALEIEDRLLRTSEAEPSASDVLSAAAQMLAEASLTASIEVHARALALAERRIERSTSPHWIGACRKLTRRSLADESAANRIQAIRLALRSEIGLLDAVVPLLSDRSPEVRLTAMLAVGTDSNAINTDDLLRWLHDPDPGVRSVCEQALRSRGLQEEHIKMGRLMTDGRPSVRLQVVDCLRRANDLEPGVWLRHLSHDSAAAVRAAAVRAATEQRVESLKDRLEQMAQNDPCASVRQLAQYYLLPRKSGAADFAER